MHCSRYCAFSKHAADPCGRGRMERPGVFYILYIENRRSQVQLAPTLCCLFGYAVPERGGIHGRILFGLPEQAPVLKWSLREVHCFQKTGFMCRTPRMGTGDHSDKVEIYGINCAD